MSALDVQRPFVLLDDARAQDGGSARLYRDPVRCVVAHAQDEVIPALAALREARDGGLHAAGWLDYEAGLAFEPRLTALAPVRASDAPPLLWFGLFDDVTLLDGAEIGPLLPDPAGAWAGTPVPEIEESVYGTAFARVHEWIAAGDIYQANLSFRASVPFAGDPLALYARLRGTSRAGWGGIVHTGAHWLLSSSPELFFTLDAGRLSARPMKGTVRRDPDPEADRAAATALVADAKQRAENLMIVDLLRNDLARVAKPGSVAVPALFTLETYPTLHTLTSTVTAQLAPGRDAIDVVEAIFPCGSITGAPKIRAMEIIAEIEVSPRGPYTGSIGWLDPEGNAAFNVAIRTLVAEKGASHAVLGLGSGIVADSESPAEWRECLAKGAYVTEGQHPFDLIETMRFDPAEGIADLERHLARMKQSAARFGFLFDRHAARNELQAATFPLPGPRRVRLRLSPSGTIAIEVRPLPAAPEGPVTVALQPLPVPPRDFRLAHKTSDRAFYDEARRRAGAWEVIFCDEEGFLTEGSFTNLFVERDGRLVTPPLARGLLPGILRDRLIAEGGAVEGDLKAEDLTGGFLIGNALRGLVPAALT
ncbi:aminodeoxychorismate synthase component I [Flavisphingomonas formosensis]|uniref:aminodeoxychorismate synthase component I n=1 Tax=Flavisphingomonas formosensis TaxID=861534 RepID=UPI0012F898CE|nr:aminodeoxychorismate synthase component I [Sphingomonas formosensis]